MAPLTFPLRPTTSESRSSRTLYDNYHTDGRKRANDQLHFSQDVRAATPTSQSNTPTQLYPCANCSGDHRATAPSASPARQISPPPPFAKHTTWPPTNATTQSSARDLHQSAPRPGVNTRHHPHHSYRDQRPRCKTTPRMTAATTPASPRLPALDTNPRHAATPTSTTKSTATSVNNAWSPSSRPLPRQ